MQCGSPTNELSLKRARAARKCHRPGRPWPVNALETLNVGRGRAHVGMSQMQRIIAWSRAFQKRSTRLQAVARQRRTGRGLPVPCLLLLLLIRGAPGMEENVHPEAVAHESSPVRAQAEKSVRLESASRECWSASYASHVIETAEEIHAWPPDRAHLVEKRKRDARVLNIYEGPTRSSSSSSGSRGESGRAGRQKGDGT